jgi:hypothetical protein
MGRKHDKLERDARAAMALANNVSSDDGGTCNMDFVTLTVPRLNVEVENALQRAGVTPRRHAPRTFALSVGRGQGAMRTGMCVAFVEEMRRRGWDASVFYLID